MSWKNQKKSSIQNIAFILFIALLLFHRHFVKVQLNRLLAFSPKTITASEQNKFQATNGN
jgi:hypothetical protein